LNYSITFRCNLDCKYCGVSRLKDNLASEELGPKEVTAFLRDKKLKKLRVIVISGGEPFLKDDLDEILLAFKKNSSSRIFHITTNGFLTERIVESLKFLKKNGLKVNIKISIDDIGEKHDILRNRKGSFERAVNTIQRLRERFSARELLIGINHTLFEENYNSIPEVRRLAEGLGVIYRGFVGLKERPLYSAALKKDYGLVDLSPRARGYLKGALKESYKKHFSLHSYLDILEDITIRHYIKGQLKMLEASTPPRHKCMCLFTHFRMNPNGDVITCSYDLDLIGNIKNDTYSGLFTKKAAGDKLKAVKKCGRCWLGCEVSPNWVSCLCAF
jgi:MoaA/NifB/PqqE/SkfB family radical SAM enzyme